MTTPKWSNQQEMKIDLLKSKIEWQKKRIEEDDKLINRLTEANAKECALTTKQYEEIKDLKDDISYLTARVKELERELKGGKNG